MKLRSIELQNFMPYKGTTKVEFPLDPEKNVLIITGNNMRGKTSFLNALRWAFYGKVLGRHSKEIPLNDVLNRESAEEKDFVIAVRVEYESEGDVYVLHRNAKKRDLVAIPSRTEDFIVSVGLERNGLVVPQAQIDFEINKFVPEQVSRFFLFDGELLQEYESLLVEGDEQGKRIKEAIENVLGVPSIVRGREVFTTLLRDARNQQNKDLASIKGLELKARQQRECQESVIKLESDLAKLRENLQGVREQKEVLTDEIENLEGVYVARGQKKELDDRQKAIELELREAERLKAEVSREAWIDILSGKLSENLANLQQERDDISARVRSRNSLESRIQNTEFLLQHSRCPVCDQEIGAELKQMASGRLADLNHSKELADDLSVRQFHLSNCISRVEKLLNRRVRIRLQESSKRVLSLRLELSNVETRQSEVRKKLAGLDLGEIDRKKKAFELLVKEEGSLERTIEQQQKDLDFQRKELTVLGAALSTTPNARGQRSTKRVERFAILEQIFENSIEELKARLRTKISEDANDAFFQLTTQKKYKSLTINANYGLSIVDEKDNIVTLRSAGAEQIVALSLIVALGKTGRVAGPIVMDTPFGRLDRKHRSNILRFLPFSAEQLILLVHDGEVDLDVDFESIWGKVGGLYVIEEVNSRRSQIVRGS